jgi:hypothetical protein
MSMKREVPLIEGTRVKLYHLDDTGKKYLSGTICGLSTKGVLDFYIVKLDFQPPNYPYSCATVIESEFQEITEEEYQLLLQKI